MSQQSSILESSSIAGATATWFPTNRAVTGTVTSTSTRVVGTGTSFTTEISAGDWMVNSSNEAVQVAVIESDTVIELYTAFTVDLTDATVTRIKDKSIKYLKVIFITSAGTVKGASQTTAATWPASIPWESASYDDFIQPQLITPSATGAAIIVGK